MREFAEQVMNLLAERLDDVEMEIKEVDKNNTTYTGICIRKAGSVIAPTIYMDQYKKAMDRDEVTMEYIIDHILSVYSEASLSDADTTLLKDAIEDWNIAKKLVKPAVRAIEGNSSLLSNAVYTDLGNGLAEIYRVVKGGMAITITDEHIDDLFHIPLSKLRETAWDNMEEPTVMNMMWTIMEIMGIEIPDDKDELLTGDMPMFLVTNDGKNNGAAYIANNAFLKKIYDRLKEHNDFNNLYILPSSIHEFLCVTDIGDNNTSDLLNMVKLVNASEVPIEDKLIDAVFIFDGKELRRYN